MKTKLSSPKDAKKDWSFIKTSREILEKNKSKGDVTSDSDKLEDRSTDNMCEADPDIHETLSSSAKPRP